MNIIESKLTIPVINIRNDEKITLTAKEIKCQNNCIIFPKEYQKNIEALAGINFRNIYPAELDKTYNICYIDPSLLDKKLFTGKNIINFFRSFGVLSILKQLDDTIDVKFLRTMISYNCKDPASR